MKTDESVIVILRIHEKTCQRLSEPRDPLLPIPVIELPSPGEGHCFLTVALTVSNPL